MRDALLLQSPLSRDECTLTATACPWQALVCEFERSCYQSRRPVVVPGERGVGRA